MATFGALALSSAPAGAEGTGSISGTYSIESPVAPVFCGGSASVYDSSGSQVHSVTFPAGTGVHDEYRFDHLEAGDYRVGFQLNCMGELDHSLLFNSTDFYRGKGSLADATPIHVTEGSIRTGINSLSDGGASISGTVTDDSGNPLDDICVDTYDDQGNLGNFGRTGPDGSYVIDQFTAGDYRLKFSDCLDPGSTVVPEFYDDKASLEEAAPVSLAGSAAISGIDAQLQTGPSHGPGPGQVPTAKISMLSVKGPAKARKGRKSIHRVRITNSGNATATGVRLKVRGRGVRLNTPVGAIPAGTTRAIKVWLNPKRRGKTKLTFKVTSSNAGTKSVKRRITVRR